MMKVTLNYFALAALLLCQLHMRYTEANTLAITIDNMIGGVYIDGEQIGSQTDANASVWQMTTNYDIADDYNTIAIYGTHIGGIAGMLFSDDIGLLSDGSFKCIRHMEDNWYEAGFDDSNWPAATVHANNGAIPWGSFSNISPDAKWIWSSNYVDPPVDANAYCRWSNLPQNPFCFCHGHADPLVVLYDGQSIALPEVANYMFSSMTQGCVFESYIATGVPSELVSVGGEDLGVLIITRFKFEISGSNFVEFDDAGEAKHSGTIITANTYTSNDVTLVKTTDGWNMTWCEVTVMWSIGSREFLVSAPGGTGKYETNTALVIYRSTLDNMKKASQIDLDSPVTALIKLTNVRFWARRIHSLKVCVYTKGSGNQVTVKAQQTITPTVVGLNVIDVSMLDITADVNDYIGFEHIGTSVVPFSFNGHSWGQTGGQRSVGDTFSYTTYWRTYSFSYDYEFPGTMTTITTTSVTLITPRQYGGSLTGLCGNCDKTQNDLSTDAAGQPINAPGTAGIMMYIMSYSVPTFDTTGQPSK